MEPLLEAILFTEGGPVSRRRLATLLQCPVASLEEPINALKAKYNERGVVIVDDGTTLALTTNPSLASSLKQLEKEEAQGELSNAVRETLSIITYAGPIAKRDIDFLRGVNTHLTLRRLLIRGLIQEHDSGNDHLFSVTVTLLQHLAVQHVTELKGYDTIRSHILEGLHAIQQRMQGGDTESSKEKQH